jgi:guanylate kinase
LNVVGIEQKARKKKERSVIVFGLPASTASTPEAKQREDQEKVNVLFNSLQLGNDFASQIEQVHRFKTPNEPEKIAPIQVTVKMDGNGGPMWTATEITKAAKCLKDNPNFKSVYINPDLTQSQQILLKRLIKERIQKNSTLNLTTSTFRYGIRGDQVVKIKNIII